MLFNVFFFSLILGLRLYFKYQASAPRLDEVAAVMVEIGSK